MQMQTHADMQTNARQTVCGRNLMTRPDVRHLFKTIFGMHYNHIPHTKLPAVTLWAVITLSQICDTNCFYRS